MRDLSISARLIGGFLAVVALIAITGFIALRGIDEVSTHYQEGFGAYSERALVASGLEVALLEQVRAQKNYLLRGEPRYLDEAARWGERVQAARAKLGKQRLTPSDGALLAQLDASLEDLAQAYRAQIEIRRTEGIAAADRIMRGKAAAALVIVEQLVSSAEEQAAEEEAQALRALQRTRMITAGLIAGIGLLALGLGMALSLSITRPLGRLKSQLDTIAAEGAPPVEPAAQGRNEIAEIARAFHELVQKASLLRDMEARARRMDALSSRTARAQEEERGRIARELHDSIGQALTAIGLNLSIARRDLQRRPEAVGQHLEEAKRLIGETLDDLHRLVFDLRPPALDNLGLIAALEAYARDFSARSGVKVDLQADELEPRLAFEAETTLYRICQEALTNIAKHARARNVTVHLGQSESRLNLTISDDGVGFDTGGAADSRAAPEGVGLLNMERRAEELGGRFQIESAPQQGTTIRVSISRDPRGDHE